MALAVVLVEDISETVSERCRAFDHDAVVGYLDGHFVAMDVGPVVVVR